MTGHAALELDTLTIRIPIRLQRRGGRKLIMTPEGAVPTPKPRRDDTLIKALVRAHRWRRKIEGGQAKSITDLAEQEGVTMAYVCRTPAAHVPRARHSGGDPGREAAKVAQACGGTGGTGRSDWDEQRVYWCFGSR